MPEKMPTKKAKNIVQGMTRDEIRPLVDTYYRYQEHRIALYAQVRELIAADVDAEFVQHFAGQTYELEKELINPLGYWAKLAPVGWWSQNVKGIGPVLSAALLAHIDITKAETAGAIWRFAGLDPTMRWEKGQKRPWNADLKVLCWKIGDSFVKVSGNPDGHYGHIYRDRKVKEQEANDRLEFSEQAAEKLHRFDIKNQAHKRAYENGQLPPGHIDMRARRYAVKRFLSDWFTIAYWTIREQEPPYPYPHGQLGHVHYEPIPHQDALPEWLREKLVS